MRPAKAQGYPINRMLHRPQAKLDDQPQQLPKPDKEFVLPSASQKRRLIGYERMAKLELEFEFSYLGLVSRLLASHSKFGFHMAEATYSNGYL